MVHHVSLKAKSCGVRMCTLGTEMRVLSAEHVQVTFQMTPRGKVQPTLLTVVGSEVLVILFYVFPQGCSSLEYNPTHTARNLSIILP